MTLEDKSIIWNALPVGTYKELESFEEERGIAWQPK